MAKMCTILGSINDPEVQQLCVFSILPDTQQTYAHETHDNALAALNKGALMITMACTLHSRSSGSTILCIHRVLVQVLFTVGKTFFNVSLALLSSIIDYFVLLDDLRTRRHRRCLVR